MIFYLYILLDAFKVFDDKVFVIKSILFHRRVSIFNNFLLDFLSSGEQLFNKLVCWYNDDYL